MAQAADVKPAKKVKHQQLAAAEVRRYCERLAFRAATAADIARHADGAEGRVAHAVHSTLRDVRGDLLKMLGDTGEK